MRALAIARNDLNRALKLWREAVASGRGNAEVLAATVRTANARVRKLKKAQ